MKEYRCPQAIVDLFNTDSEEAKSDARRKVYEWTLTLNAQEGDLMHIPDPDTGEMTTWVKGPRKH